MTACILEVTLYQKSADKSVLTKPTVTKPVSCSQVYIHTGTGTGISRICESRDSSSKSSFPHI